MGINNIRQHSAGYLKKVLPDSHLDLSSIGQGYSVKRLASILETYGVDNYLVEIGGEMQVRGHKPDGVAWRIAIEKPHKGGREVMEVLKFSDDRASAVMTSGTYRHFYESHEKSYSHVIDARTLKPVEHATLSVTVIHNDAALADAWSTALLCLGSESGMSVAEKYGLSAVFIDDGTQLLIKRSSAFIANYEKSEA